VAVRGRGCVAARGEPALIAALPVAAAFVPGRSLAGVRLGEPAAQVRAHLGTGYGVCRGCATTTWYFTYRRFDDRGLGVELTRGRVSAVYTLWRPEGWHGTNGLRLDAAEGTVTARAGGVVPVSCSGYTALVAGTSAYLIVDGRLWGFALFRRGASPCR
jgi:hypothetical protein